MAPRDLHERLLETAYEMTDQFHRLPAGSVALLLPGGSPGTDRGRGTGARAGRGATGR